MIKYLSLAGGVICIFIAFFSFILATGHWRDISDEESTNIPPNIRTKLVIVYSLVFLIFATLAYKIFSYLSISHYGVLQNFGIWYVIGFVSNLLLLIKSQNQISKIDEEDIFYSLFVAIAGPLITVRVLWNIFIKNEKGTHK